MPEEFQYIKMPDGSYGKFRSDASDAGIRAAIEKDFPEAYRPKTPIAPTPIPQGMQKQTIGGYDLSKPMPSQLDKIEGLAKQGKPWEAAHETISDLGANLTPALAASGLLAPAATFAGLLTGTAGKYAGGGLSSALGASPEQSEVIGDLTGIASGGVGAKYADLFSPRLPSRGSIGEMARSEGTGTKTYPKGKLKPSVMIGSRIAGAAAGGAAGGVGLGPYGAAGGIAAGWKAGPQIADAFLPEHPNALMPKVPKHGDILFSSPKTTSTAAGGYGETPMELPAEVREIQKQQHILPDTMKPKTSSKSLIVDPFSPAPHVEGSYWSFKQSALRDAVLSGDREAAVVYKQRFGTLPPGARYVTDVGDKPNKGLYRSDK